METQSKLGNKLFTALLVLLPVLNIYGLYSESLPIGEILLLLSALLMLVFGQLSYKRPAKVDYFMFFLVILPLTLFDYALGSFKGIDSDVLIRLLKDSLLTVVVARGALRWMDVQFGAMIYRNMVVLLGFIIILQMIMYLFINDVKPLALNSTIFQMRDVGGYNSWISFYYNYLPINGFRPTAFFSEPAKYAHYAGFCMVLILWKKNKKRGDILSLFVIVIALLISRSGAGIIYIVLVFAYWLYERFFRQQRISKYVALGISWTVLILLMLLIYKPGLFSIFLRITEVINVSELSSGSLRVFRGWEIYGQLPWLNQICGVGMKNIVSFLQIHSITTIYDAGYLGYLNGLSEIFVTGGLISAVVYLVFIWRMWRVNRMRCKTSMIHLLLAMLLIAASFHSEFYMVAMAFLLCFANDINGSVAAHWE